MDKANCQICMMHEKLLSLKIDLHMGNSKDALAKVNELINFMETEILLNPTHNENIVSLL